MWPRCNFGGRRSGGYDRGSGGRDSLWLCHDGRSPKYACFAAEDTTAVAPGFCVVCGAIEEEDCEACRQLRAAEADEAAMEKLRRENPDLVKAEEEFFASRDAKEPKTEADPSTAVGPSAPVINIEDSDESRLSDFDSDDEFGVDWRTNEGIRPLVHFLACSVEV
ncbi:hypothetical protein D1007_50404 [Hordeum vulgare]|nr:hypothetical protein D1007_50404 [Hordeum vulgare]